MEHFATLLTDYPLDERQVGGLLLDISHTSLAGAMQQHGLEIEHSFGNAEWDSSPRTISVRVRPANTAPKAALTELLKAGFRPSCSLEFDCPEDQESKFDAWALVRVYSEQLQGWIATCFLDYETACASVSDKSQLLQAPVGGRRKGVLVSAHAMKSLA